MILDTCALLWLASGNRRLSRTALKEINDSPALWVSAISGFEIALKEARGKLDLPEPPTEWFAGIVDHHGISLAPLELDVCIKAARLPGIHDDPCDRFIIAAALLNNWPVVTEDERFEEYGVKVIC
jgi:PIN domain nuclease of toxin-antitoxin system